MDTVEVTIGGRRFRLQCGAGEAFRVHQLARLVDQCAAGLIQGQRGLGEEMMLLMTSLVLADQLDEARSELERLKGELARVEGAIRERAAWAVATAARRLDALAAHIERSAAEAG
ncbi:cell division protein ZapA [Benzoatithermus flavus]|uniref:Cell division protein ZapA n=1 Tax=Benzoatithermus flavus TaxID=3108223 RepID=A0ABU8XR32_9PROT